MVWRERRSPVTATLARRLIAAGMIVLGETHTVEFAMGGWGTNQHLGTPWNPWDFAVARSPGGSSRGSGVAVASGMAPWAIGSDTGGSVRLPASWCGLSGLRTTIGRVSTYGILPLAPSLDAPGPMARSVEDAALLYSVMQGADPLDPRTLSAPAPSNPMPGLRRGVRGLRLARMPNAERDGCTPEMLAAYDAALDTLGQLGAEIVDLALACPCRCRSAAGPMTNRPPCGSAGPTSRQPTGTSGIRPASPDVMPGEVVSSLRSPQ